MTSNLPSAPIEAGDATGIQTFSIEEDRIRLTPAAIEAMTSLAGAWHLTGPEAAALLGVSVGTWRRIKARTRSKCLSQDQLLRASVLVGMFRGLHLLFANDMANKWPRLPNRGPLFEQQAPIAAMIEGGVPLMLNVRRHVDALRNGL